MFICVKEHQKVYGYVTNTRIKLVIVVDNSNTALRDNEIRWIVLFNVFQFFKYPYIRHHDDYSKYIYLKHTRLLSYLSINIYIIRDPWSGYFRHLTGVI